ncbi:hypothetical protein D3C75_1117570 [compost metagenome]
MLSFGEHESDEQRTNRFSHMYGLGETGNQKKCGEDDEGKELAGADIQHPVQPRYKLAAYDQKRQHIPQCDQCGQQNAT